MTALLPSTAISAITLFTEDLEGSKAFYATAFGLPVVFEDENSAVFRFDGTLINLLRVSEAAGLITPAPAGRAGGGARSQLTISVEDVDAACAELGRRGVQLLNGPADRPWGVRTAAFADPAGHVWELAQPLR
jgi:lactoylglutathione lyase